MTLGTGLSVLALLISGLSAYYSRRKWEESRAALEQKKRHDEVERLCALIETYHAEKTTRAVAALRGIGDYCARAYRSGGETVQQVLKHSSETEVQARRAAQRQLLGVLTAAFHSIDGGVASERRFLDALGLVDMAFFVGFVAPLCELEGSGISEGRFFREALKRVFGQEQAEAELAKYPPPAVG